MLIFRLNFHQSDDMANHIFPLTKFNTRLHWVDIKHVNAGVYFGASRFGHANHVVGICN